MKSKSQIIGVIVLTILFTLTLKAEGADFRNMSWGMKMKQVKALETRQLLDTAGPTNGQSALMYEINGGKGLSSLCYFFTNNKLTSASCIIGPLACSSSKIYYEKHKKAITKKYGPITSEVFESDGIMAIWETKRGNLQLIVGNNGPKEIIYMLSGEKK